jgi:four helix bundle protein
MLAFQKLDVYQRAAEFLAFSGTLCAEVPRGNAPLLDQLRRAATSVTLNIAEGCGRITVADRARTYSIARGSAMECAAVLDALKLLNVLDEAKYHRGIALVERVVAMLTRMCRIAPDRQLTSTSASTSAST